MPASKYIHERDSNSLFSKLFSNLSYIARSSAEVILSRLFDFNVYQFNNLNEVMEWNWLAEISAFLALLLEQITS